ncbi:MAG TPA: Nramp family divalent metal transporter [Beijerinckiaceae bacterium]|nr:Nramp family divalent metal transporter [Beijerinckiaceae bacterium]
MDKAPHDAGAPGWRRAGGEVSLPEAHHTIGVPKTPSIWRKFLAFAGPGYLVAVGYMDPGNWATSLAGGSRFGYALLFVVLMSNIMAIILQSLCARLAFASGRDLAQACRDSYPRPVVAILWFLAEIAIIATDLAEVIGTAIGLKLLFGIPLELGVVITALDVFLIMALQRIGFRAIEAVVIGLLTLIAACFAAQIAMVSPVWSEVFAGFSPTTQLLTDQDMLYLALGIIGATVMPHNLYLHSAIVQTRAIGETLPERREAMRLATIDSTVALMLALLINASILILAATAFYKTGRHEVAELGEAHALLAPIVGTTAPVLFAVALIACGLNSTVTATLAGQIVMEGFIALRLRPWLRRLVTRLVAIVPAAGVTILMGEKETAKLLILSQVILSLQLPFAVIPLVVFTASRAKMGALVAPRWLTAAAALIAAIIVVLNLKLLSDTVSGWLG